jgi:hypothetical protein
MKIESHEIPVMTVWPDFPVPQIKTGAAYREQRLNFMHI